AGQNPRQRALLLWARWRETTGWRRTETPRSAWLPTGRAEASRLLREAALLRETAAGRAVTTRLLRLSSTVPAGLLPVRILAVLTGLLRRVGHPLLLMNETFGRRLCGIRSAYYTDAR